MHHFVALPSENAYSTVPGVDPQHTVAIKRWTRDYLKLSDASVISVNEFACSDPGCPLLETVIAVFDPGGGSRKWKLTRPRMAVTKMMIQQALSADPGQTKNPERPS